MERWHILQCVFIVKGIVSLTVVQKDWGKFMAVFVTFLHWLWICTSRKHYCVRLVDNLAFKLRLFEDGYIMIACKIWLGLFKRTSLTSEKSKLQNEQKICSVSKFHINIIALVANYSVSNFGCWHLPLSLILVHCWGITGISRHRCVCWRPKQPRIHPFKPGLALRGTCTCLMQQISPAGCQGWMYSIVHVDHIIWCRVIVRALLYSISQWALYGIRHRA